MNINANQLTPRPDMEGFKWILQSPTETYYIASTLYDNINSGSVDIDSIPVIEVKELETLVSTLNAEIDSLLDFEVSDIQALSDDDIIQCALVAVGVIEDESEPAQFTITPKEIQFEPNYVEPPEFTRVRSEGETEPRPTTPPDGYIPFVNTLEGTLSPKKQWRWTGSTWTKI